jgi:Tfp pilus assembly protein PilF
MRRLLIVFLAAGVLGALGAALWLKRSPPPPAPAQVSSDATEALVVPEIAGAARKTQPVIFVGLDGADWQLLDVYMADGSMPNLARLVKEGAGGILDTQHPPLSPLVWTTMMTGVDPLHHGILDFTRFNPVTGAKEPITSDERRVPAVWNMASWADRRSVTLGLWATYPAEHVDGILVSDRMFTFLYKEDEPLPGVVFPPQADKEARHVLQRAEAEVDFSTLHNYLPWLQQEDYERYRDTPDPYGHPVSALRRILVETRVYHELGLAAIRREKPDLAIVYFQGTDSIGHVFAPFAPPHQPEVSKEDYDRYHEVPRRYFHYVDGLLGEYAELARQTGAVLMLASDHGFTWSEGRPTELSSFDSTTAAKWHRKEGMYVLWGPGIEASPGHPHRGGVAQVCATLLQLMGLPPGQGLAMPPLPPVPAPPGPLVDYGARYHRATHTAGPLSAEADREAIEKLQALGYIGDDSQSEAPEAVRASGSTRTAGSYNNEGVILKAKEPKRAIAALEKALEIDPNLASACWNLSDLLSEDKSQWDRSDELLLRAFAHRLPRGTKFLIGRAIGYQRGGFEERSLRLLEAASRARPDEPEVWLFLGRYRVESGECGEAAAAFREAIRLAPDSAAAHSSLGLALICAGDAAGARTAFQRSLEIDPRQPKIREFLKRL